VKVREIIGLDIGSKCTGIARASSIAKLSEPLMSVPADSANDTLREYINEHEVEAIAVGLPRNLSGDDTKQTEEVRAWVRQAQEAIDVPFYWQDEALTSREAADELRSADFRHQKFDEHALAAAIILQDFIDTAEGERVPA
jgi:putative Holliday junction resolvase